MDTRNIDPTGAIELRLMRARFAATVADWELTDGEAATLIGLPSDRHRAILEGDLDVDTETRMRLTIEVGRGLGRVFDRDLLLGWLHEADEDGEAPLAFMSRGVAELRAMRAAASIRAGDA